MPEIPCKNNSSICCQEPMGFPLLFDMPFLSWHYWKICSRQGWVFFPPFSEIRLSQASVRTRHLPMQRESLRQSAIILSGAFSFNSPPVYSYVYIKRRL